MFIPEQKSNNILGGAGETTNPMSNLLYGGTNGFLPEIMGTNEQGVYENWLSNAPHVETSVIPVPLKTPAGFDLFDTETARTLKKMWIELLTVHAYTIEGLNATITLETDGRRFHNQSQEIKTVVGSKMEVGMPTYTFIEKPGKPIKHFLDFMSNYLSLDYRTQSKIIHTLPNMRAKLKGRLDTPDLDSGSIMFIQLDTLNTNVQEVYFFTNFRLLNGAKTEAKRDLGSNLEILEYSVPTEGLFETNRMYKALAQEIVDKMTIFGKNPDDIKPAVIKDEISKAMEEMGANGYNRDNASGINDPQSITPDSVFK